MRRPEYPIGGKSREAEPPRLFPASPRVAEGDASHERNDRILHIDPRLTSEISYPSDGSGLSHATSASGKDLSLHPRVTEQVLPRPVGHMMPDQHTSLHKPGILVVGETPILAKNLRIPLGKQGFPVRTAAARPQGILRALAPSIQVAILGPRLAQAQAIALCRELREERMQPSALIVLFTYLAEEMDRVEALEAGADDCISAPFGSRAPLARIEGLIRMRAVRLEEQARGWPDRDVVRAGLLVADRRRHQVRYGNRILRLTYAQRELLRFMILRCGLALSRNQLQDAIRTDAQSARSNPVDGHIAVIRRQLGSAGNCIETLEGYGFKMHRDPLPDHPFTQP